MGGDEGSKLEMRCSADEAWYDGTLRFATDSNDVIVVHFNNFGEEEDETFPTSCLLDPRKLKSRVRVRSQQLQDFQCKLVNEGQNICGCLEDRGDRKYYDAKVVSILKKKHSFSDDSEECNCDFRLIWLDGPKKGKATSVGCAEVCFLSNDAPEDDPMVKNLVKRLTGNGELRPKLTPKALPSPRPRPRPKTPSLSLEIAASKKQASAEPSPPSLEHVSLKKLPSSKDHLSSTLPNHRVQLGKQGNAKSVGSKKKRIMQAEHPDLASDNDVLNNFDLNARPSSTPKDRSREGSEDARGHGNVSDDSEQKGGGGESTKKGFVICEKRRLVKVKAPKVVVAPAPEVIREEKVVVRTNSKSISIGEPVKLGTEKVAVDGRAVRDKAAAVREEDDILRRVKEPVKSNTKKMATTDINAARDEAAVVKEDDDVIRPPVKWRAKFNTSGKKATPGAACKEAAAVREDGILHSSFKEQENSDTKKTATPDVEAISLTLGERVKLKSLEKSKSVEASPQKKKKPEVSPQKKKAATHKVSLLKVGMQIAGGKMPKNLKQVQLVSRLSSKPDEATRPGTTSRPNDVAATEPMEQQQKRKPGRPRKHHLPEPVTQSLASKKQPIQGFTKEQRQNTQQEEIIDAATTEKLTSDPATKKTAKKKRPREELSAAMADTEDIASDKSTQEVDETLDEAQHVTKHPRGNKDIKTIGQSGRERQQPQNDDALSDKSADNDEDHTSLVKSTNQPRQFPQNECENSARAHANDDAEDRTSPATNTERTEKKSIADGYYDIVMKYDANRQQLRESSVEKTSEAHEAMTPGSSEELTGSPPRDSNLFQQDTRVSELRVTGSPPRDSNLFQQDTRVSELRATGTPRESNASGKKRRRHMVLSDDEDAAGAGAGAAAKTVKSGSLDSSATSQDVCNDAKTTSTSALDEEGVVQKQGASRLLLISNMEMDVSAHDAMQVLMELTEGVCAVHVLPVGEFQSSTAGYGLYRDSGCALKALQLLARGDCFIVSPKGRPWIISQSKQIYGSHLYGFVARTAFQSNDSGVCGIISDQPPTQKLVMVTKQSNINAYSQALQRSKIYEEHQKWRKELHDRIVQDEMKS